MGNNYPDKEEIQKQRLQQDQIGDDDYCPCDASYVCHCNRVINLIETVNALVETMNRFLPFWNAWVQTVDPEMVIDIPQGKIEGVPPSGRSRS